MPLPVRRALLSVSDKTGLVELARALVAAQRRAALHRRHRAAARGARHRRYARSRSHTGFPEIMDGRVKTLHPKIHGGLLGRRGIDDAVMAEHGIAPIDLLVVNLYPFAATVARPGCSYEEAIENIDIGGPAMLRAAAKNHAAVAVVVDPADYGALLAELDAHDGGQPVRHARAPRRQGLRPHRRLRHHGGRAIWRREHPDAARTPFPTTLPLSLREAAGPALRREPAPARRVLSRRRARAAPASPARSMLQGKELSFNNIADADTAIECVRQFDEPACVIVKHANPCGVAIAASVRAAYEARLPHRPDLGLRRHHRLQPRARCRHRRRHHRAAVRRGDRRTGRVRGGARACSPRRPNVRVLVLGDLAPERQRGDSNSAASPAACCVQTRDLADLARARPQGASTRRQPTRGGARGPAVRLARVQVREVERHRLRARRAPRSASAPGR